MNGTSVMTGLACLAYDRARRLARWACRPHRDGQRRPARQSRPLRRPPLPRQAASRAARVRRWIADDIEYTRSRPSTTVGSKIDIPSAVPRTSSACCSIPFLHPQHPGNRNQQFQRQSPPRRRHRRCPSRRELLRRTSLHGHGHAQDRRRQYRRSGRSADGPPLRCPQPAPASLPTWSPAKGSTTSFITASKPCRFRPRPSPPRP